MVHNGEELVAQAYTDEVARYGYTEGNVLSSDAVRTSSSR
jgi:hypothetical protein